MMNNLPEEIQDKIYKYKHQVEFQEVLDELLEYFEVLEYREIMEFGLYVEEMERLQEMRSQRESVSPMF